MSVAIGIMDREEGDQNTDIIVFLDPEKKALTWIPRDFWSERIQDRVNVAFQGGGHHLFLKVLEDLGFAADFSLIVWPSATHNSLESLELTVPVSEEMKFYYPMAPLIPIEEGRKIIEFLPPQEILSGERIHQWLGARSRAMEKEYKLSPDFERIERQKVFVRELLKTGFDFQAILKGNVNLSADGALEDLAKVRGDWDFRTHDQCTHQVLDEKAVLIPKESVKIKEKDRVYIPVDLKKAPILSIIIPTWNKSEWTLRCIRSVRDCMQTPYEIIWIDNGSTDEAHKAVLRELQQQEDFRYERYPEPLGFPKAINKGIALAEGMYICFLNNDVEVMPGWEKELISALKKHPGGAGPLSIQTSGWQGIQYHPWLKMPHDATSPEKVHSYVRNEWAGKFLNVVDVKSRMNSDHWKGMLAFFCVIFNAKVVKEIGLLDEIYEWGYYEDLDYCDRLQERGYTLTVCPGSLVKHAGSVTVRSIPGGYQNSFKKNAKIYHQRRKKKLVMMERERFRTQHVWWDRIPAQERGYLDQLGEKFRRDGSFTPMTIARTRLPLLPPSQGDTFDDYLVCGEKKIFSMSHPFFMIRLGVNELAFLDAGFHSKPLDERLLECGLDRDAIEIRGELIEAVQKAHVVGVHQSRFELGVETETLLSMLGIPLPLSSAVEFHLIYHLFFSGKLDSLLKGKKILLIGNLAGRLSQEWPYQESQVTGFVKTAPPSTQAWRQLDSYIQEAQRQPFDVALIAAGAFGKILAHRIFKMGKTALDVGSVFDALLKENMERFSSNPILSGMKGKS